MKTVIISGPAAGSILRFRLDLMQEIKDLGYQIVVVAPAIDQNSAIQFRDLGFMAETINTNRCGMNPFEDVRYTWFLRKIFKKYSPIAILSYTVKPILFGSLAATRLRDCRFVSLITGLGYAFHSQTVKQRFVGFFVGLLYKNLLPLGDVVLFQNVDDYNHFRKLKLISHDKPASVIDGSGVNLEQFPMAPPALSPITFSMFARFNVEKGILDYISAAIELKKKYPDIRIRLIGAPDENPSSISIESLKKINQDTAVEIIPWVPDVRPWILESSVVVLPSYREGVPRSLLEAMAMGRAIISTDAPGCREVVLNEVNGYTVPIKNPCQLASAMERFICDPKIIELMGLRGREYASRRFDVKRVNQKLLAAMHLR